MARTAIAIKQSAWECKWSRPGLRLAGVEEAQFNQKAIWVCVRTGTAASSLAETTCDQCPYWEADKFRNN